MKIKIKRTSFSDLPQINSDNHPPKKPNLFFKTLLKLVSFFPLKSANFKAEFIGMEKLGKKQPCLILMNHSSFIDLEIAASLFYPRPINIVATADAFVGKDWLLRQIGCIKTIKYTTGVSLVKKLQYAINTLRSSIVMFPEAGYSLDGRSSSLPDSLAKCVKLLGVPLIFVKTTGAFLTQPLYNELILRKTPISAKVEYLLSEEEIKNLSVNEIDDIIREKFSFNAFKEQFESNTVISHPERAKGLHRILYKCPHCKEEGKMLGEKESITCLNCGESYNLTTLGKLEKVGGEGGFTEISDWVDWEKQTVKEQVVGENYSLSIAVSIFAINDSKCLYSLGDGTLIHNGDGFILKDADGVVRYTQSKSKSHTINCDFYFYEIGDVVNIGDSKNQYYCFPKDKSVSVYKIRLAAEELFKKNEHEKRSENFSDLFYSFLFFFFSSVPSHVEVV